MGKKTEITLKNKRIMFLRKKEGEYKLKKWDKEQKKLIQTEELHHWVLQTFSIDLGTYGREKLGFCNVEYWGEKPLVEGMYIDNMTCYLKQKKWVKKDPRTFMEKKLAEVILVMTDYDRLLEPENNKNKYNDHKYNRDGTLTPDESIALAIEEYGKDKFEGEQIISVNDELPPLQLEEKE